MWFGVTRVLELAPRLALLEAGATPAPGAARPQPELVSGRLGSTSIRLTPF